MGAPSSEGVFGELAWLLAITEYEEATEVSWTAEEDTVLHVAAANLTTDVVRVTLDDNQVRVVWLTENLVIKAVATFTGMPVELVHATVVKGLGL